MYFINCPVMIRFAELHGPVPRTNQVSWKRHPSVDQVHFVKIALLRSSVVIIFGLLHGRAACKYMYVACFESVLLLHRSPVQGHKT